MAERNKRKKTIEKRIAIDENNGKNRIQNRACVQYLLYSNQIANTSINYYYEEKIFK